MQSSRVWSVNGTTVIVVVVVIDDAQMPSTCVVRFAQCANVSPISPTQFWFALENMGKWRETDTVATINTSFWICNASHSHKARTPPTTSSAVHLSASSTDTLAGRPVGRQIDGNCFTTTDSSHAAEKWWFFCLAIGRVRLFGSGEWLGVDDRTTRTKWFMQMYSLFWHYFASMD